MNKPTAEMLARDLSRLGHEPWLDSWKIRVGQSITQEIERGVTEADFIALLLTKPAVESRWVEREWRVKFWDQVSTGNTYVLPCLLEECEIPKLLADIKYANFTKSYSIGLAELVDAITPTKAAPSLPIASPSDDSVQIARLLTKVHAGEHALSTSIAEGLELARELRDPELEAFCREELTGVYPDERPPPGREREDAIRVKWRVVEAYASTIGPLNPNFIGFQSAASLWSYVTSRPTDFVPMRLVFNQPLRHIENEMAKATPQVTALILTKPYGELNADADDPDRPVQVFLRPDVNASIVEAVRAQFVQRLLALMPVIRSS